MNMCTGVCVVYVMGRDVVCDMHVRVYVSCMWFVDSGVHGYGVSKRCE